jgi:O-antigen/teichoic acid export membrane protein
MGGDASVPFLARILHLAKASAIVGATQVVVQAIGLISGFLIIRLLPTQEYALYTLGATVLATAVVLADGGVANGVMAEGGKVLGSKRALANVVATGIDLRKKFAPWSALICAPTLIWILRHHGASWTGCVFITAAVIPAFLASVMGGIFEVPLKLGQDLARLQQVQLGAAVLRLLTVATLVPLAPWAAMGLFGNALAQAWSNRRLGRTYRRLGDLDGRPQEAIRDALLRIVRLTLPGILYYCISGPLMVWLLSVFGTTTAVAQVGALGRLAALLTVISSLLGTVIVPRFARLENHRRLLMSRYGLVLLAVSGFSVPICALVWLFPDAALSILGPKYRNLHAEALLMAMSSCFGLVANTMASLASARGLLLKPHIVLPIGILATVAAITACDVSTALGVLTMAVYLSGFSAIFAVLSGAWLIRRRSR